MPLNYIQTYALSANETIAVSMPNSPNVRIVIDSASDRGLLLSFDGTGNAVTGIAPDFSVQRFVLDPPNYFNGDLLYVTEMNGRTQTISFWFMEVY